LSPDGAKSLSNNHPFVDGSKRLGAACAGIILGLTTSSVCSVEELFIWAMELAKGSINCEELASQLYG
jgi:prophage maintenance system killer protein